MGSLFGGCEGLGRGWVGSWVGEGVDEWGGREVFVGVGSAEGFEAFALGADAGVETCGELVEVECGVVE